MVRNRFSIISLLVLLFATLSVFGQSLGEIARKNQADKAAARTNPVPVVELQGRPVRETPDQILKQNNRDLKKAGDDLWRASANAEESEANALASKTSRALGNDYAGDIQFPHREEWEGRLDTHKVALVSALRELIKARRAQVGVPATKKLNDDYEDALTNVKIARTRFSAFQSEGASLAADWERKASENIKSKFVAGENSNLHQKISPPGTLTQGK